MKTFGIILLIMLAVFAIGVGVVFNYTNPPEHVHEYGKWENRTEPTCTEAGVQYRVCECNAEETREVPATGHKFGEWQTKSEPTCEAAGVEYRVCTCGTEKPVRALLRPDIALAIGRREPSLPVRQQARSTELVLVVRKRLTSLPLRVIALAIGQPRLPLIAQTQR